MRLDEKKGLKTLLRSIGNAHPFQRDDDEEGGPADDESTEFQDEALPPCTGAKLRGEV